MPLAEAAKYVAAAYAAVLLVLVAYLVVAGRRVGRLRRDVRAARRGALAARRGRLAPGRSARRRRSARPVRQSGPRPTREDRSAWNRSRSSLFWFAYLLYAGGFVCFAYYLFSRSERAEPARPGLRGGRLGSCADGRAAVRAGRRPGHVPVVGTYESLATLSWALVAVYLVLEPGAPGSSAVGLYVLPVGARLADHRLESATRRPSASCRPCSSDIVVIHVGVIFTALAAFLRGRRGGAHLPARGRRS